MLFYTLTLRAAAAVTPVSESSIRSAAEGVSGAGSDSVLTASRSSVRLRRGESPDSGGKDEVGETDNDLDTPAPAAAGSVHTSERNAPGTEKDCDPPKLSVPTIYPLSFYLIVNNPFLRLLGVEDILPRDMRLSPSLRVLKLIGTLIIFLTTSLIATHLRHFLNIFEDPIFAAEVFTVDPTAQLRNEGAPPFLPKEIRKACHTACARAAFPYQTCRPSLPLPAYQAIGPALYPFPLPVSDTGAVLDAARAATARAHLSLASPAESAAAYKSGNPEFSSAGNDFSPGHPSPSMAGNLVEDSEFSERSERSSWGTARADGSVLPAAVADGRSDSTVLWNVAGYASEEAEQWLSCYRTALAADTDISAALHNLHQVVCILGCTDGRDFGTLVSTGESIVFPAGSAPLGGSDLQVLRPSCSTLHVPTLLCLDPSLVFEQLHPNESPVPLECWLSLEGVGTNPEGACLLDTWSFVIAWPCSIFTSFVVDALLLAILAIKTDGATSISPPVGKCAMQCFAIGTASFLVVSLIAIFSRILWINPMGTDRLRGAFLLCCVTVLLDQLRNLLWTTAIWLLVFWRCRRGSVVKMSALRHAAKATAAAEALPPSAVRRLALLATRHWLFDITTSWLIGVSMVLVSIKMIFETNVNIIDKNVSMPRNRVNGRQTTFPHQPHREPIKLSTLELIVRLMASLVANLTHWPSLLDTVAVTASFTFWVIYEATQPKMPILEAVGNVRPWR
eukprot:GHVT01067023.1.p1 GENE.GHVT01067023.1~~GHVT01067023.1.p1  ORF type:complete len:734 (+),score=108.47 GHVT01067023.1:162-2363(+)